MENPELRTVGVCRSCQQQLTLTAQGECVVHEDAGGRRCPGSHVPPVDAARPPTTTVHYLGPGVVVYLLSWLLLVLGTGTDWFVIGFFVVMQLVGIVLLGVGVTQISRSVDALTRRHDEGPRD